MNVAKTILEQLGGHRFISMTGARNLIARENGLSFRLPGAGGFCKDNINYVEIVLTPMDVYAVGFFRIRGAKVVSVKKCDDVYAENLQEVFSDSTGLRTRL